MGYNRCVLFPTPCVRLAIKQKGLGVGSLNKKEKEALDFLKLDPGNKIKTFYFHFWTTAAPAPENRAVVSFVVK